MTIHQIRKAYLNFFEKQGHHIIPSSSLLPENDPTTLFTGSGMQPMVPFLLGEKHPDGVRISDSQKCFRSQDIEEVGDNRHTTFFEMLGNWSLGDYFKQEQIPWIFEFLTEEIGLDAKNLYITVFRGNKELGIERDTESVQLWKDVFASKGIEAKDIDFAERDGMQDGRIFYYDESKNWWSRSGVPKNMPVGEPGGPDSEMFWDFGAELGLHETSLFKDEPCHVNCDCGRFLEIGNSVFMEYRKTESGFEALPNKNVDFGGGLERMAAAVNGDPDIFRISVFTKALQALQDQSGSTYGENEQETKGFRVVLDHIRAATFLIGDGIVPSNKDQGYFVRRLIRRAIRFGKRLGVEKGFTARIAEAFIEEYVESYPSLQEKKHIIVDELSREEDRFMKTLEKGEKEFEKIRLEGVVSGKDAFILYSTYGFPLELTTEMVEEAGEQIDLETFKKEFEEHRAMSRAGSEQKFTGGLADHSDATVKLHTATHMLHQALRTVLGDHVFQKGSNITPERLRFDFSHSDKMTDEEKHRVEEIVNEQIHKDLPVHYEVLDLNEAKKRGAVGVFDDKYAQLGGKIKVYFIGEQVTGEYFSTEVCGGPHVERTGSMGIFRIKKEESVAAGVRRIKAVLE
ncbi:alanine--tRNA ligase [Candidatus Uhrbacteria bacterium CG_4_9_14_3_um_filter_50_9]|uniref:Alanine--tRNA ligase n=1 Tax=Candidatus Uhrbacteria bacterium CG_4_9_14_3_um_filter_50_9 TaxID=1975035 RepID=A0A2M7XDR8_9BACT|nr:MAG: alanine--tRNA ligase [Candidatus Uhrbacteria bacterium CG_4_9_14_3_um_filter_50_9]